jgi:PAS domain S-box-containing protein
VAALTAYNVFFVFPSFTRLLTEVSEEDSVRIATHLKDRLVSEDIQLRRDALPDAFKKEAELLKKDFRLMKILVLSPSGETIYSSDPSDVGHMVDKKFFDEVVSKGGIYTEVRKDTRSVSGQTMSADVVETYIPIMREGRFFGACEVYMDITGAKTKSDRLLSRSFSTLFILVFALLAAVVAASYKANKSITARRKADETLRESEEKYRSLFEKESDAIILCDKETLQILDVNDSFVELYGYSKQEICGMKATDLSAEPENTMASIRKTAREGSDHVPIRWHKKRDGTLFPLEISLGLFTWKCREVICAIMRDITERKRADEKLNLFSQAIEEAMDGVQITDLEGYVLYSNKAVEEIYGFSPAEFLGKHVSELNADKEFAGKVILPSIKQSGRWNGELTVMHKNGRVFPIWLSASIVKDDKGKPVAMVGIIRDITERKRVRSALLESETRYRMLFESAREGILILDTEGEKAGKIVAANKAAAEMHGYSPDELLAMNIADLDTPEAAMEVPERIRRILRGEWLKVEITHHKKDGTIFPVEINAGSLELGGHKYVLAFDRDISERKTAEQEREKLIRQLQDALAKIKTLRGLIPMCAWCKKIRDDSGYWKKVETYIQEHSDASFTHGICPECLRKHDPFTYEQVFGNEKEAEGFKRERRQFERARLTKPLDCVLSVNGGESQKVFLNAFIENISDAGMCVRTDRPLEKGRKVTFSDGKENRTGIVKWQEQDDIDNKTYRVGIQFVRNSAD